MARFAKIAALFALLASIVVGSAPAGPTDPPYPSRIDFPAPTVDPATGVVTTNFSPEGMAVSGNTFYAGSTATGEIIKGDLKTGQYQRNWVPASPAQPSDLHRGVLGLLVDAHNRLWAASSVGMACGGPAPQPACPAGTPSPQFNYGALFVYDATTGQELAQYTTTNAPTKTMNDITIADNAVFVSNTTAPGPAGTENQIELRLGPGGALPPGDTPPPGNTGTTTPCGTTLCPTYKNPAVVILPTPGFTGADGIDTLPNGHVLFTSFTGASSGQMINMDPETGKYTYINVTAADRPAGAPPLLSLDGVTLDGNMLYAPENRLDAPPPPPAVDTSHCPAPFNTLSCPGDWAAIHLDPPDYLTGEVITRLNSPPGSGLPPLRSPANMEQLGHSVYGITRVLLTNPVNGMQNVTQTFIERLDKLPLTATGAPVSAVEGASFSGPAATFVDPNNGPIAADSYPQQGSSAYGYTATVDWGDGSSSSGTVSGSNGSFTVSGTHAYAEEGSYTVTTKVGDAATGATIATATSTATVADAPITVTPTTVNGVEGTAVSGVIANVVDANHLGSAADLTATINWGDGSPTETGVVSGANGSYVVSGSHVYADQGTYSVSVTVTDDGGSRSSTTSTATIAFAPGCRNAGDVHADAHFQMPSSRRDLHVDVKADCNAAGANGIGDAHVSIDAGSVKIDARNDRRNNEITTVKIVGNTASIVGSDHGDSFVVVVTDGGRGKGAVDTVDVTVWDSAGNVIFDSSTLTAKHSPNVEVHQR